MRTRSSRRSRRHIVSAQIIEYLEDRRLLATVNFSIDPQQDNHPISKFVYGVNQSLDGNYANATFTRLGGNRWTAWNWENNASNAGSDWYFQNDGYLGGGETPGGAVIPILQNAASRNAGALLTIPINGYVAADKNGGGDVRNSGSNYLQTRFRQEVAAKGGPFSLTPDTTDAFVYQDEFVNWVNTSFPAGQTDPNRPIFFSLDNEPDLWSSTHAEVHPAATTYAELISKTISFADAIKDVAPNTQIFGPVNYGWNGYVNLQNAPDSAGRDFQAYYLQQLAQAEAVYGHRLVDVLDMHWYPEATGGGIRITGSDTSDAVVAARLQAPRSLWDPTYTETSWITQWSTLGPIRLLPRMREKISQNYAGTKLAITEYNYGGGSHISGGIAQADVLGVFGREGVFAANSWALASNETFIQGGFRMFRNFDGANGSFGDVSIRATTDDIAGSSVYASLNSGNANEMIVVAINKTGAPLASVMNLAGVLPGATVSAFQLTGASAIPQAVGSTTVTTPQSFSYTLPAYSVTTLRIVGLTGINGAPTVATPATASQNPVTGTTVSLSVLGADDGGESLLKYTWSAVGSPPAPVTFSANGTNAAKNVTATFAAGGTYTLRATISDGSLTTTSDVTVTVSQTLTSIAVSPATTTINIGTTKQFAAVARDQFGNAMATQPSFTWSVSSGGGSVTSTGLFTAPTSAGTSVVGAAVGTRSGSATVTIVVPVPAAPTTLKLTAISRSQINLSWLDKSGNESGFLIERSLDGINFTQIAMVGPNVQTWAATGLLANTRYYFRVRAWNSGGNSAYSNTASVKTKP
ncbi:MAG: hypothetical protein RIT02_1451 [Planctomycetota bacterium]